MNEYIDWVVEAACRNKLIGTVLNLNDDNYNSTSQSDNDRQRIFNITQP